MKAADGLKGERNARRNPPSSWGDLHPLGAVALFFAAWLLVVAVVSPVAASAIVTLGDPALVRFGLEVEALATVLVPTAIFFRFVGGAKWRSVSLPRVIGELSGGAIVGVAWFTLAWFPLIALGFISLGSLMPVEKLAWWILSCVVNAAFQEILVRGYAFQVLDSAKGVLFATVVTTAVFVLFHPGSFAEGPIAVGTIAAASILLSLLRLATNGLAAPIAAHVVWNVLGGIGFGVVSLADDYPSLFDAQLIGPSYITGGSMALEGSVVALAATVLLCLVVAALVLRRRSRRGSFR